MYLKIHSKVNGIPKGRVVSSAGVTDHGASQVTVYISALDAHDFPEVVASLRLSVAEARDIAANLIDAALLAETQARL